MSGVLTFYYLFPVGITVAILAISLAPRAQALWIPIYFIWLGMDPKTSLWWLYLQSFSYTCVGVAGGSFDRFYVVTEVTVDPVTSFS
jgi:hypothetical protein